MPIKNNPDKYCPICGKQLRRGHKCSKEFLSARDAQMKVERVDQTSVPKTEGQRLFYGFSLLALSGDDI